MKKLLIVLLLTALGQAFAAAKPYNVLVIQTDEHHFKTLGCYGGKIVSTPNIDWIAKNGAIATSFYATTPVCSPSRAALVSGRYPQATPVTNNNIPLGDDVVTFAEMLRRKGYKPATPVSGISTDSANRSGRPSASSVLRTTATCSTAVIGKYLRSPKPGR